jgi:hypothetical protein
VAGRYPVCEGCGNKVPFTIITLWKGKRTEYCDPCARKAGWYGDEHEGQLRFDLEGVEEEPDPLSNPYRKQ